MSENTDINIGFDSLRESTKEQAHETYKSSDLRDQNRQNAYRKESKSKNKDTDPFARFLTIAMLEWLALDQLAVLRQLFTGDALYEIYCNVRNDEARHVAMGLEYLHRAVEERSREEIQQLCDEAIARVPFSEKTLSFMDSGLGRADGETHAMLLRRHEQRVRSLVVRGRG